MILHVLSQDVRALYEEEVGNVQSGRRLVSEVRKQRLRVVREGFCQKQLDADAGICDRVEANRSRSCLRSVVLSGAPASAG